MAQGMILCVLLCKPFNERPTGMCIPYQNRSLISSENLLVIINIWGVTVSVITISRLAVLLQ